MLTHEQFTLPNGVEVDIGIADLLTALWELGLRTRHSCQGTPNVGEEDRDVSAAYISFPEAEDAYSFFSQTLEAISTPQSLAKIVVSVRLLTKVGEPGWQTRKRGAAVSLEIGGESGATPRDLRGCARFDPELMPKVTAAFAAKNAGSPPAHPEFGEAGGDGTG